MVDVIVVLVALPSLTILALLLEANTRGNWLETSKSRYTVFGLGLTLAAVCLAMCMYLTSRIGGKMWSGAIPSDGSNPAFSYYVSTAFVHKVFESGARFTMTECVFDCSLDNEERGWLKAFVRRKKTRANNEKSHVVSDIFQTNVEKFIETFERES